MKISEIFNEEVWKKNVGKYQLVNLKTKKVIEEKYLLHDDSALLNNAYNRDKKNIEWRCK